MKVKFTLEEEENKALRQALEDIPTCFCGLVACPDMDGNACDNCPIATINYKMQNICDCIEKEILPMLKEMEK